MLRKLKDLREDHENGFTLIELLVVILIIGILASIAIPVFLNQRKTANDGVVESDVKNASLVVEDWIAGQKGKNTPINANAKDELVSVMKLSEGVTVDIKGSANSYCVLGQHENGKKYVAETPLTYDSPMGGLGKTGGACDGNTTLPNSGGIGTGGGDGEIIIPTPGAPVEINDKNGNPIGTYEAWLYQEGQRRVTIGSNSTASGFMAYYVSSYNCANGVTIAGNSMSGMVLPPGANTNGSLATNVNWAPTCTAIESFVISPDEFDPNTIDKSYTISVRATR